MQLLNIIFTIKDSSEIFYGRIFKLQKCGVRYVVDIQFGTKLLDDFTQYRTEVLNRKIGEIEIVDISQKMDSAASQYFQRRKEERIE